MNGTGLVESVKTDFLGSGTAFYINLDTSESKVQCITKNLDSAAALNKGDTVTFSGVIHDVTLKTLQLLNCNVQVKVVAPANSPPATSKYGVGKSTGESNKNFYSVPNRIGNFPKNSGSLLKDAERDLLVSLFEVVDAYRFNPSKRIDSMQDLLNAVPNIRFTEEGVDGYFNFFASATISPSLSVELGAGNHAVLSATVIRKLSSDDQYSMLNTLEGTFKILKRLCTPDASNNAGGNQQGITYFARFYLVESPTGHRLTAVYDYNKENSHTEMLEFSEREEEMEIYKDSWASCGSNILYNTLRTPIDIRREQPIQSSTPIQREVGIPYEKILNGRWYSKEWKYGYELKDGVGVATSTNSPNFAVGQEIIRLRASSDRVFTGEQVYKDGKFYRIIATLQSDGRLFIQGEKNVSWIMTRE